jgi:two-component system, NarL family, response regulator DevR
VTAGTNLPTEFALICGFRLDSGAAIVRARAGVVEFFVPLCKSQISVFLLVQNRLLREALASVLGKDGDIDVVGASAFSSDASLQIESLAPRLLVMDAFASYLDFIREILRERPDLRVVMIGMDVDEFCFLQVVRAGATGYVLKDSSSLEVVAAIRGLANGEAACPPQMCALLFRYVARQGNQVPSLHIKMELGLSNREQQLVRLIGRGLTNKEIALELHLAEQTVRNHVHRTLRKLGADNRLAAVEACRLQGLAV